jgi:D-aminopeptidase
MTQRPTDILIIADIEGSSGCWDRRGSSFMTAEWSRACVEMSRDVDAVVQALFAAGVNHVTVKDFHRTAYNLLPELIDPRARVILGYKSGPVPGLGNPTGAHAVMFLGMHAASGTEGFMAHTLTSRIKKLEVNGKPLSEVELFSASLAPYVIRPIFFSGCSVACAQAQETLGGIRCHAIDKSCGPESFNADSWRFALARAAVESLHNSATTPYNPEGPFKATVTVRGGDKKARVIASRWGFGRDGSRILLESPNIKELYSQLIRLSYLTPFVKKILPVALFLYNIKGRLGLEWVRRRQRSALQQTTDTTARKARKGQGEKRNG